MFIPKLKLNFTGLIFLGTVFSSCSSSYQLVKSNRIDYALDSGVVADSAMIKLYQPYRAIVDVEMNKVVAYTDVTLTKSFLLPETLMGNFFADAVLTETLKLDADIDFAMPTTNGGIRREWPKGPITMSEVFELMPFENEIMIYTLSGEDTEAFLNDLAKLGGQPVARLKMKIVDKKPTEVLINGKPFDKTRKYRIMTSDYIGNGGDSINSFKNALEVKIVGLKVRDAILNYVTEQQEKGLHINTQLDGRITKN
ncbi:5'-nucleotidase C-terminal domain-containing protein [Pedobacter sp. MC2016-14]|uniref:5'-nucleotidase C-terminal domain-containing protein n=1 Tax=Pedobacter sp. MC2016-14 TaxID=2897327 RepID=UPI001E42E2A7|nr:5'-nucleotidase [Pedobacter sp. MC2016-14]MCD0489994.1 5'-nucleotidase C-terminal domain-containing protein [Pedobacter sp. MC2016-14]